MNCKATLCINIPWTFSTKFQTASDFFQLIYFELKKNAIVNWQITRHKIVNRYSFVTFSTLALSKDVHVIHESLFRTSSVTSIARAHVTELSGLICHLQLIQFVRHCTSLCKRTACLLVPLVLWRIHTPILMYVSSSYWRVVIGFKM